MIYISLRILFLIDSFNFIFNNILIESPFDKEGRIAEEKKTIIITYRISRGCRNYLPRGNNTFLMESSN